MNTMSMYVISNGDLAREVLNAVVTLLGTATFATAIKISVLFAILGTVIGYVRGKDVAIFAKWFLGYFAIIAVMVCPIALKVNLKVNLEIIDSSNQGAVYTVGNVPIGLAYPASLITSAAHGLITVFEEAFHVPDDLTYNRTGMLFGSRLFRLSAEFHIINPEVKAELNEYVKNCVIGDILITKKYSMMELTESTNLLETITKDPSNIRGIYVGDVFKTCRVAAIDLKKHIEKDAKEKGFKVFGKRIFSGKYNKNEVANKLPGLLKEAYSHFNYDALSSSALQIMTQNLLINGIRDGLLNYTAESGATAAILNFSTTKAMQTMRVKLATSRNIATYTIPLMHTILLLLMISLFPIMVLISFQPSLTSQVLKNYLYTLIWIESWPIMFACLNMVVTFYAKEIGPGGLTISNINQLVLEHSDISNMAGYLMLSIPFISGGLVKGMSSAFNHAASYIGGVMQSSAASAASEAASGNIYLGNSSWNNVNANKFDTNTSMMRGMATEQLKTGVLRTSRPDGETTYDGTPAISKLPTSVRSSEVLSSSLSEQAEEAKVASVQDQKAYDQAISSSASNLSSLGETLNSGKSFGEGVSSRETASVAQNASEMWGIAKNIAKRNNLEVGDVFRGLANFSQSGDISVSGSIPGKALKFNLLKAIGIGGKAVAEHTRTSEASTRHNIGRSVDITADESRRFSENLNKVEEYSKTHHAETSRSALGSHLSQLSTDLRGARTATEHYAVHKSESDRLSKAVSYVRQNSGQIDSDLNQENVNYTIKKLGRKEAESLFAGKNRAKFEAISREHMRNSGIENDIISRYQHGGFKANANKRYQSGYNRIESKKGDIGVDYAQRAQSIKNKELEFDQLRFNKIKKNVENNYDVFNNNLKDIKKNKSDEYYEIQKEVVGNVAEGEEKSKSSAFNVKDSIKPDSLNPDKRKKK